MSKPKKRTIDPVKDPIAWQISRPDRGIGLHSDLLENGSNLQRAPSGALMTSVGISTQALKLG